MRATFLPQYLLQQKIQVNILKNILFDINLVLNSLFIFFPGHSTQRVIRYSKTIEFDRHVQLDGRICIEINDESNDRKVGNSQGK